MPAARYSRWQTRSWFWRTALLMEKLQAPIGMKEGVEAGRKYEYDMR